MTQGANRPEAAGPARCDVAVIGGGPAGLAAAIAARQSGASVVLIEREPALGGILKQCIHDGFGLVRFGQKLSGPEYAQRFIAQLAGTGVQVRTLCFVSRVQRHSGGFRLTLVSRGGMTRLQAGSLVLATGCRERTARQVAIHGTRPAGIFTAGTAQHYVNLLGLMPTRRCVILGSGDIGLIMARRLTLEGAQVLGVYEAKPACGGLTRNLVQCLHDFDIPLHLSHTVTHVFGHSRVQGVQVARVDGAMRPIPGTEKRIDCDALILSVGLIPENELAESLNVPLHPPTGGPVCDQDGMSMVDGVFCCGNALHVSDIADYVSENGEVAGSAAARWALEPHRAARRLASLRAGAGFLYAVPQRLNLAAPGREAIVYFRAAAERGPTVVRAACGGRQLLRRKYRQLRPPEMERILLPLPPRESAAETEITLTMEEDAP